MKTPMIKKAAQFAADAHTGQTRRYTGEPYITHPAAVASIVSYYTQDEEVICAAWLHDVIEDCGITQEQLAAEFTPRVAQLVSEVSDIAVPAYGNRKVRFEKNLLHLVDASDDGKTIKLADILHNICSGIVVHDPEFAALYLNEKAVTMLALIGGNHSLYCVVEAAIYKLQGDL
jgi:(p)ppGpp synthase/HD superfamily hydrolase